jgi:hypothetical protein
MKSMWLEKKLDYDGTQLRPLFNYLQHRLDGPSVLGFRGACQVDFAHMIDGEDLREKSAIAGSDMVHLLIEFYHLNLFSAVAFQRLIADLAASTVYDLTAGKVRLARSGDDLYLGEAKFSISIATKSAVSELIHFAVNVSQKGTPVKTCALEDFGINPEIFGRTLIAKVAAEFQSCWAATEKVRPV